MKKTAILLISLTLATEANAECETTVECAQQAVEAAELAQSRVQFLEDELEKQARIIETFRSGLSVATIELVSCAYPHGNQWWNTWDGKLDKRCPANQVMVGANSVHDNGKEDRVRKYLCCSLKLGPLN